MALIDPDHPFFRRPATRWATVVLPIGWAGFELWIGNTVWAAIFAAVGGYAFWALFLNRKDGQR